MRILLTGASGQVGGAIRTGLIGDHEIAASSRSAFDLANSAMIAAFIAHARPQLIINCAAYTAVDDAERGSGLAAQINGIAPGVIAKAALEAGAASFTSQPITFSMARLSAPTARPMRARRSAATAEPSCKANKASPHPASRI